MGKCLDVRLVCQHDDCALKIDGHDMVSCRADELEKALDHVWENFKQLLALHAQAVQGLQPEVAKALTREKPPSATETT